MALALALFSKSTGKSKSLDKSLATERSFHAARVLFFKVPLFFSIRPGRAMAQPIIRSLINGKTQEAVSRETGITQSLISYHLSNFRVKLQKEFERKGFEIHLSKR